MGSFRKIIVFLSLCAVLVYVVVEIARANWIPAFTFFSAALTFVIIPQLESRAGIRDAEPPEGVFHTYFREKLATWRFILFVSLALAVAWFLAGCALAA